MNRVHALPASPLHKEAPRGICQQPQSAGRVSYAVWRMRYKTLPLLQIHTVTLSPSGFWKFKKKNASVHWPVLLSMQRQRPLCTCSAERIIRTFAAVRGGVGNPLCTRFPGPRSWGGSGHLEPISISFSFCPSLPLLFGCPPPQAFRGSSLPQAAGPRIIAATRGDRPQHWTSRNSLAEPVLPAQFQAEQHITKSSKKPRMVLVSVCPHGSPCCPHTILKSHHSPCSGPGEVLQNGMTNLW